MATSSSLDSMFDAENRERGKIKVSEEGWEMKLILAIVSNDDASSVSSALTKENYSVTRLATTGGFLRAGNTTIIVGTEDEKVDHCIEIIGNESQRRTEIVPSTASYDIGRYASFPVEVQVGGATIFVLDVEQFKKL